jgi:hypothetical protein
MIVFGEAHLRRILGKYAAYYESRIHRSLNKDDPFYRAIERVGAVTSSGGSRRRPCCHRPIRRRCCSGRCSCPFRKVGGWQTLATKPVDQPIDLAA